MVRVYSTGEPWGTEGMCEVTGGLREVAALRLMFSSEWGLSARNSGCRNVQL